MLAVDESTSDINRPAEEPLDPQRVETNGSADRVDDGIDGPDLVKLHVFRRDMMNVAFGYCQLCEDIRRDALHVRVQGAVPNHAQDFGCPLVKVLVTMLVRVPMLVMVLVTMVVTVPVLVIMIVFMTAFHDHIELHSAETGSNHAGS